MSPGAARQISELNQDLDVRDVLPTIPVPTLVMHRPEALGIDKRHARYIAAHIPGARLAELPGRDTLPFLGDAESLHGELEEFFTGERSGQEPNRCLATVLFTDIVGSTKLAAELGDAAWRERLASHDALVRRALTRYQGQEVKTLGDGFLATFDGPARAIQRRQPDHRRRGRSRPRRADRPARGRGRDGPWRGARARGPHRRPRDGARERQRGARFLDRA